MNNSQNSSYPVHLSGGYFFNTKDVLLNHNERQQRKENLFKGLVLSNTYRKQVQIIFETKQGIEQLDSLIHAASKHHVILNDGTNIPVNCIKSIHFDA